MQIDFNHADYFAEVQTRGVMVVCSGQPHDRCVQLRAKREIPERPGLRELVDVRFSSLHEIPIQHEVVETLIQFGG
jgi:hypothetical protein